MIVMSLLFISLKVKLLRVILDLMSSTSGFSVHSDYSFNGRCQSDLLLPQTAVLLQDNQGKTKEIFGKRAQNLFSL